MKSSYLFLLQTIGVYNNNNNNDNNNNNNNNNNINDCYM